MLTGIKQNNSLWVAPDSETAISRFTVTKGKHIIADIALRRGFTEHGGLNMAQGGGGGSNMRAYKEAGYTPIPGFQLRYMYFIDPSARERCTVPILPFSEIERRGARMYKGVSLCAASIGGDAFGDQPKEGGAAPTAALHTS